MNTYGLDVGYFITPALHASAGYYYQHRSEEHIDGSAIRGRLAYEISDGLTAGLNVSHDFQESDQFETRVSADLKMRFGGASTTATRKKVQQLPVINALTSTPSNRDVRVHDRCWCHVDGGVIVIESVNRKVCAVPLFMCEKVCAAIKLVNIGYDCNRNIYVDPKKRK